MELAWPRDTNRTRTSQHATPLHLHRHRYDHRDDHAHLGISPKVRSWAPLALAVGWHQSMVIPVTMEVEWSRMLTRPGRIGVPRVSLGYANSIAILGRPPGGLPDHQPRNTKNGKKLQKNDKKLKLLDFFRKLSYDLYTSNKNETI